MEASKVEESCGTCRFWKELFSSPGGGESGVCRREPPVLVQQPPHAAMFPQTESDCWCGEYQAGASCSREQDAPLTHQSVAAEVAGGSTVQTLDS